MPTRFSKTLIFSLACIPMLASAAPILPGLWEVSTSNMQVDGQAMPGMDVMLEKLKSLPPEQRQMMEQVLAKQGVQLGSNGVQVCMSEAQVNSEEIPLQDPQSGCTQQVTERSDSVWKFSFNCPQAKGQGETRFISQKEFTSNLASTFNSPSGEQKGTMQTNARWLSADCGSLKPRE